MLSNQNQFKSPLMDYHVFGDKNTKHIRIKRDMQKNNLQICERDQYSQEQNLLYKRALLGFNAYTQEDLKKMSLGSKKQITATYKKTQKILNLWTQKIVKDLSDNIFFLLFPESKLTKEIIEDTTKKEDFGCKISFKDLGLSKTEIINKLYEEKILPQNFYSL
jgi:hypothetical protein